MKLKGLLPRPLFPLYHLARNPKDVERILSFLLTRGGGLQWRERLMIVRKMYVISCYVQCAHSQDEALSFIEAILSAPQSMEGCVVEAGAFKGGSAAKFSVAASFAGRSLFVFDSFSGIPFNDERHDRDIWGGQAGFARGDFCGTLEEVRSNITKFGSIETCHFIEGWFEESMPHFNEPIVAAYLDVDLASSTRTCVKYLYPLLVPGGIMFSQDGHLPLVIDVLGDENFWLNEVGCRKPNIIGLGSKKLIKIVKS